jgi:hypothetical protein
MTIGPDFVLVRLTAAGVAMAKQTPMRISNGRISVLFPASNAPVKVARYEWDLLLKNHAPLGEQLVEVTAAVAPDAPKNSVPAPTNQDPKEKV